MPVTLNFLWALPVASDHSHVDFKKIICDCHQGSHKSAKEVCLRSMVT